MKSPENPYGDVEVLELALALALRVPRFPAKGSGRKKLGPEATELEALLTPSQVRVRAVRGAGIPTNSLQQPTSGLQSPSSWHGRRTHFDGRHGLIRAIWAARERALDELRLLPQPDNKGRWERAVPIRFASEVPSWESLPERLQRVLKALGGRRKTAKQLSSKLGGYNNARKLCAELVRLRILRRPSRDGYVFDQVPRGMPDKLLPKL